METIAKCIPDFTDYLLSKQTVNFNNYFFLLTEENIHTSANPFISCLIAYFLKNNTNTILMAAQESLNHYSSIMKKFGINLNSNDKFCFIDLFNSPVRSIIKEELPLTENFPNTYNPNRSKFYISNATLNADKEIDIEKILENLQLKKLNQDLKTVLIFDNLSILPNEGKNLISDVNYTIRWANDNNINLIMNVNKELSGNIYNTLYNLSDMELEFKQNESGYSKDIDGLIKFYLKTPSMREWLLRYNIKENGMNFFTHLIV